MAEETQIAIYVLKLENDKYYVGRSMQVKQRIDKNFNGEGSAWTKKHKPVDIVEIARCKSEDEDVYLLKYMNIYGINNVRGGAFSQIKLSDNDMSVLKKMIHGNNDHCFICGSSEHWAATCTLDSDVSSQEDIKNESNKRLMKTKHLKCDRCDRTGHTKEKCYASTTKDGVSICGRCDRTGHTKEKCYASTMKDGEPI
jgi:hypothetical protein